MVQKHFQLNKKLGNFRIFCLKSLEKSERKSVSIKPYNIIRKSTDNINSLLTKRIISLNQIEKKSLASEWFKEWFNKGRLKKVSNEFLREERYHRKIYDWAKIKLRQPLEVGEELLVLSKTKIHLTRQVQRTYHKLIKKHCDLPHCKKTLS